MLILAMFSCLGYALYFLVNDRGGKRMARALAVRVGLSIVLVIFLLASWKLGLVDPRGA